MKQNAVGYLPPSQGPFSCSHCQHLVSGGCNQKEVIAALGANKSGLATVEPSGCCNEFEKKSEARRGFGSKLVNPK
jgi:hypothetical protein